MRELFKGVEFVVWCFWKDNVDPTVYIAVVTGAWVTALVTPLKTS